MRFSILRSIGWGIALYACMYLAFALLAAFGLAGTVEARIAMLAVLLFTTLVAARTLSGFGTADKAGYVILWVVTIAAIDALFASASGDWSVFSDPNLWIGYGLVLGAPFLVPKTLSPKNPA